MLPSAHKRVVAPNLSFIADNTVVNTRCLLFTVPAQPCTPTQPSGTAIGIDNVLY